MSNNLKFEFDFDEVIEGIKLGVMKELTDVTYDNIEKGIIEQSKRELVNHFKLEWNEQFDIKKEIKNEVKDKVFNSIIDDIKAEQKKQINEIKDKTLICSENSIKDLEDEIIEEAVNRLYGNLVEKTQKQINKKLEQFTSKFINNFGGNNIVVLNGDNQEYITKEEYDELIHRNEILEALEQGGVDNWEWYGESINQYFDNEKN